LQWLPVLAWGARWAGIAERRRVWLVAAATVGTTVVGCFALVQTLAGRSRFDVTPVSGVLLAAGVICLVVPAIVVAAAVGSRVTSPR
jgi:hypothetical protein